MPKALQTIIVGMPPGATYLDTHIAEQLQKLMMFRHYQQTLVLFVKNEDKCALLEKFF